MDYFTDRELGKKAPTVNEIDISVWNGIVAIFDSFIADNSFSKEFPEQCPDGQGIFSCNTTLLYDKLKALIPGADIPIQRKEKFVKSYSDWETDVIQVENTIDTFSTLDLIEFCFRHLYDSIPTGNLHEYFNHFHLTFKDTGKSKQKFQNEINALFERNGIAYSLNNEGKITRIIPEEFQQIINRKFQTKDATLNQLLSEATQFILLPKISDRLRAIEKLWDAFERAKTFYSANKKVSATQLIKMVANGNGLLEEYLTTESATLTEIGNKFQIRHFETDKQPITDTSHIDYLFYRMFSLIDLFIKELEK
jgi:hypothetical protein